MDRRVVVLGREDLRSGGPRRGPCPSALVPAPASLQSVPSAKFIRSSAATRTRGGPLHPQQLAVGRADDHQVPGRLGHVEQQAAERRHHPRQGVLLAQVAQVVVGVDARGPRGPPAAPRRRPSGATSRRSGRGRRARRAGLAAPTKSAWARRSSRARSTGSVAGVDRQPRVAPRRTSGSRRLRAGSGPRRSGGRGLRAVGDGHDLRADGERDLLGRARRDRQADRRVDARQLLLGDALLQQALAAARRWCGGCPSRR